MQDLQGWQVTSALVGKVEVSIRLAALTCSVHLTDVEILVCPLPPDFLNGLPPGAAPPGAAPKSPSATQAKAAGAAGALLLLSVAGEYLNNCSNNQLR